GGATSGRRANHCTSANLQPNIGARRRRFLEAPCGRAARVGATSREAAEEGRSINGCEGEPGEIWKRKNGRGRGYFFSTEAAGQVEQGPRTPPPPRSALKIA